MIPRTTGTHALAPPEPLAPDHELKAFESGVVTLDQWLKRRARRNEEEGASRTFVLCAGRRVVGYYSLAAGSILHGAATGKVRRNMPDPVPVLLLGRLAVDRSWHGRGLGADLLSNAVLRAISAADAVGVRAILVHAISDQARTFYERYGFRPSPIEPMTLMIAIDEARRMLG
ncbi:GNAT family N-acetyltransferase [Bradyrhizobium sp.]|uniref:GNAT family N-acetyltransferase n=1 Tax=Bradyrhizobium sp. TaxID=376 RepID=UPI003C70EF83